MNVYRIEHRDEGASPDVNPFDSGRYTPSGAPVNGKDHSRRMSNGYPFPSIGNTDTEPLQPVCLSSTLLRGDVGNAIGLGTNGTSMQADAGSREATGSRRKWGVHQNALGFHPVRPSPPLLCSNADDGCSTQWSSQLAGSTMRTGTSG